MSYSQYSIGKSVFLQFLTVFVLSLSMLGTAWADRAQALAAQDRGDYSDAAKLWMQLANQGDPLAQYNLAQLYHQGLGVTEDSNLFKYWLAMAARHGMVEAYTSINSKALQPTTAPAHVNLSLGPEAWVEAQNPNYYTLQLASSTNEALIKKYYSENKLAGKAGYYRSHRSGQDWYALVYGAYPSVQEAKAAIATLPDGLKKWSPWVRNIKSIRKIMIQ
jgi:septal ring-binding cell division protein DamX